jgi:hypothetical protein
MLQYSIATLKNVTVKHTHAKYFTIHNHKTPNEWIMNIYVRMNL